MPEVDFTRVENVIPHVGKLISTVESTRVQCGMPFATVEKYTQLRQDDVRERCKGFPVTRGGDFHGGEGDVGRRPPDEPGDLLRPTWSCFRARGCRLRRGRGRRQYSKE